MNPQQMEQMGQFRITVWEEENFQGKRCEFILECQNIMERGFRKIRSIKVENGPWVAYQFPGYRGYQYILERDRHQGEYRNYMEYSTQAHTNQVQSIRRIQH
ncbi:hypothetical protein ANANG_G00062520 [Anguilla anguilla]|uniref:Beta-crystallin A2 n=1 Tax=Anguilla anguilla TaxID=7936 RepID=A0A9D3S234_ANGAN|nr:hypothetical protein ANANG_G00062520 [Anguilla anguilla]